MRLEIGAGACRVSVALAEAAARLIALDSSRAMLAVAAARLRGLANVGLLCADARALPFRGHVELAVLAYRTVQHLSGSDERVRLFTDLRRLLVPEGVLAFDTWHGPSAGDVARQAPSSGPCPNTGYRSGHS